MSALILDALCLGLPVLTAFLGASRGGVRESVTLIGVLAGALLGVLWRDPWGQRLVEDFNRSPGVAQAFVFDGLLISITALIGYGGAVFLPQRKLIKFTQRTRAVGAMLGALNGLLMVGLLLWSATEARSAGAGQALLSSRFTRMVAQRLPQVLLLIVLVVAVLVVIRLIGKLMRVLHIAQRAPEQQQGAQGQRQGAYQQGQKQQPAAQRGSTQQQKPPVYGSGGGGGGGGGQQGSKPPVYGGGQRSSHDGATTKPAPPPSLDAQSEAEMLKQMLRDMRKDS